MSGPGRPSLYTREIHDEIIDRLSKGEPLAQICRDEGMPSVRTVSLWKETQEGFSADFAHARREGFDYLAAECLEIANTPCEGVSEKYERVVIDNPDDPDLPQVTEFRLTERRVEDMLGHRKLQIETRLKLLAKWDPKRYGERQTVEHEAGEGWANTLRAAHERAAGR